MEDSKPVGTPLTLDVKLTKDLDTAINDKTLPYRELVGSLMYAALSTRPDIAHAVSVLRQFNSEYNKNHWRAAKRVLRYLKGTINHELVYRQDDPLLRGYVDADWGHCIIDRRSYTVFILKWSYCDVGITQAEDRGFSSIEAEYMGITDAAKEALHLIGFLNELGCDNLANATIYNDNRGAGLLANNPLFHSRSKHIDIRHHFREVLRDHPVTLTHVPSEEMIADALTKALPSTRHSKCTSGFGLETFEE